MLDRRRLLAAAGGLALAPSAASAGAWQVLADREITLVVPFSPGGSTDVAARLLGRKFADLGLRLVVMNRSGGSGVEGTGYVARQQPTGLVLLSATPTAMLFIAARQNTGFTRHDFTPIALWSSAAFAFVVRTGSPIATMRDLLQAAHDRRGTLAVGSTGSGGEYQYLIEEVFREAGSTINYIGYRGGGDVATAVAGGHVEAGYVSVAGSAQLVRDGQLRYLAHTSEASERLGAFPDVPHVAAFGSQQRQVAFNALMGPRGLPDALRDPLAAAVQEATEDRAFVTAHENMGMVVRYMGPAELLAYLERLDQTVIPGYRDWRPAT
ncbi:MAG TPA: tripartite tricarboxylate transporter substrate binding protein [Crenalkalicoccus sp.]|jgi:tripartite-type tricarboxylate transporter receptor subunit TctC|nr:tripartite tricarboxylate transporter substrate binding protein [Crenalkalicoccus sp.]